MNGDERQSDSAAVNTLRSEEVASVQAPPPVTPSAEADAPEIIRLSAWMYLRTILLIAWGAFRHPFRTTYIDMASGEMVHIRPGEETWG